MSKSNTFKPMTEALVYAIKHFPKGHAGRIRETTAYLSREGLKMVSGLTQETPEDEVRRVVMKALNA